MRNVEIKARFTAEEFVVKFKIAAAFTESNGETITQRDVVFNCKVGRLKLRTISNNVTQLIYYNRPNIPGTKLSEFTMTEVIEPDKLQTILEKTNGIEAIVEKTRTIFRHKNARLHFDIVEDLGNFFEIEVCLNPDQPEEEGHLLAKRLMRVFGLDEEQLVAESYLDMIKKQPQPQPQNV